VKNACRAGGEAGSDCGHLELLICMGFEARSLANRHTPLLSYL
jgi:hypothetical protein